MPVWPFSSSRERQNAERDAKKDANKDANRDAHLLLGELTKASRNGALFGEGRVGDTLDGRFELIVLYAALALVRLRQSRETAPFAQAFVDAFFKELDSGLREDGVGDLAVPKRMHTLAGVFYARLKVYGEALAANTSEALRDAISRNVLGNAPGKSAFAAALAAHVCDLAAVQAKLPWRALLSGEGWPAFAA